VSWQRTRRRVCCQTAVQTIDAEGGSAVSVQHDVVDPATAEVIATVPMADLQQTDEAIERAARAFPAWRDTAPADRARLLRRFAEAVDADVDHLAALEVRNAGHTLGNARWEAGNVRDVLQYYSAAPSGCSGGRSRSRAAST
jgi:aldehyde dehydrogenase (NAD+)